MSQTLEDGEIAAFRAWQAQGKGLSEWQPIATAPKDVRCVQCGKTRRAHCQMDEPGADHGQGCRLMHHEFRVPTPLVRRVRPCVQCGTLMEALTLIAAPGETADFGWWTVIARQAIQKVKR